MPRFVTYSVFIPLLLIGCTAFGQGNVPTVTATCNFDADKQLAVEYQRISNNPKKPILGREVPFGKVWAPGQKPLTLFTNSPVEIAGKVLPIGAYTMFLLPSPKQWTLIVSRSTDVSGKYEDSQDIVRVLMDSGELPMPELQLGVYFEHAAPGQCTIRIDLEKTGHWTMFKQR